MNTNEKIQYYRTTLHLSREYVSAYLGVSLSAFTEMENGTRRIAETDLVRLCTLLGVPLEGLRNPGSKAYPPAEFAERLDAEDQEEIRNLIRWKEQIRKQRAGMQVQQEMTGGIPFQSCANGLALDGK